jgi:GT2 family glycosyltransferase
VSLLIPTRDGLAVLKRCLDSLVAKTTYPRFEIVIVDNQSREPATLAYLASLVESGRARVVPYDRPFNYSAINNLAAREARGEVLCLLNNDVEVITPDWLTELVSHALRPDVGAVGAKLLYPNDTIQHAGVVTGLWEIAGHVHRFLPREAPGYFSRAHLVQNVSVVTGACLAIRRELYLALGGLEEDNLAVAFNDVDFCLRVDAAGYRNVWTPWAELYHHESFSRGPEDTPEKQQRANREVDYMKRRWGAQLKADPYYNPNLSLYSEAPELAWPPRVRRPWRPDDADDPGADPADPSAER